MQRERRINPETGRMEIKLQPEGLPAIWTDEGFCERCEQFGECLGLANLSDAEWQAALDLIQGISDTGEVRLKVKQAFKFDFCS